MARLEQLVEGVQDEQLRRAIESEIAALKERTRFGLVYERHLPETVLVSDPDLVQVRGSTVRVRQMALQKRRKSPLSRFLVHVDLLRVERAVSMEPFMEPSVWRQGAFRVFF